MIKGWSWLQGGASASFKTIQTPSGTSPVATGPNDILTLVAGSGITITGNSTTDTVTIASTGGGGSVAGSNKEIQFNDSGAFGAEPELIYDKILERLGVQTPAPLGVIHATSALAQTVNPLLTASATLTNFALPGTVTGAAASQSTGYMYAVTSASATKTAPSLSVATSPSATINYAGSGYIASGNTINYIIYASKSGVFANEATASFSAGPDNVSGDPYQIDITYGAATAGLFTPDNYRIYRNTGSGFGEFQDIGNVTSFSDQNSGWNTGGPPPSPQFNDYIANANQNYVYKIYQGGPDGSGGFIWAKVSTVTSTGSVGAGGDYFSVTLSWTANNTGIVSPTLYRVYRDAAGSGYTTYRETALTGLVDSNINWIGGAPEPSPQYPDYIANNTTRLYHAYNKSVSPDVYSMTAQDYQMTDDNSGNPYTVVHSAYNFPVYSTNYFLGDASGLGSGGHFSTTASSFLEDSTTWTAGAVVTPTTYGYLSDGVTLNRDYKFYHQDLIGTTTAYSSSLNRSVIDPSDGLYYYVALAFTGGDAKVLRQINGGGYITGKISSSNFNDDNVISFSDGVTVTPNSIYASAGIFEGPFDISTPGANIVIKSTTNESRIDFRDSSDNVQTKIGSTNTGMYLLSDGTSISIGSDQILLAATNTFFETNLRQVNLPLFSGFNFGVQSQTAATVAVKIFGTTTQSANLLDFADSSGSSTNYASFDKVSALTLAKGNTSGVGLIMPSASALKTTAIAGGIEFLTDTFYFTQTTNTSRHPIASNNNPIGMQVFT